MNMSIKYPLPASVEAANPTLPARHYRLISGAYNSSPTDSDSARKAITSPEPLQLAIHFAPGDDQLTQRNHRALLILAHFLFENPQLTVRLDGFADPRGTDEYNNVLSEYRARAAQEALVAAGVNPERILRRAHGALLTRLAIGGEVDHALERRVEIHIDQPDKQTLTASLQAFA